MVRYVHQENHHRNKTDTRGGVLSLSLAIALTQACTSRSGKLQRARSRLYRSQLLQVNMRSKVLTQIYTKHSFAQLCNLQLLSNDST